MGSILKAKCSCGYASSSLYIGVGMMFTADAPLNLIFYCDDCSLVQTEFSDSDKYLCLDCMNEITPYAKGDEEVEYGYEPENCKKYHCPKCKNESLYFKETGLWD